MTPLSLPALVVALLAAACAPPTHRDPGSGPIAPPPASVLDADPVFFDPDGVDRQPADPAPSVIGDEDALDAFARRFVDGGPVLDRRAHEALAVGRVLVGGVVSRGCSAAAGARLGFTATDIRLLPVPPPDPDLECVRPVSSIALLAVDPADLPAGVPVRGS